MDQYDAPVPVDTAPSHDAPDPVAAPRRRRTTAAAAALALVAVASGLGIGYGAQRVLQQQGATAAATGTGSQGTTSFQPPSGYGFDPYAGQQSLPTAPEGSSGGTSGGTSQGSSQGSSTDASARAAGAQLTGLVRIQTAMKYSGGAAAGTGMVLTADGEVVTNHHVVAGATSIKVTVMTTGKTYTATVVGTDATDDVAVLQLTNASGLATVATDSDGVGVGEAVTAVGDGNGTTGYLSAATGSVMATGQQITTQSEGSAEGESLAGLIQISSDVVSGYSGGATYDAEGEVVGMTTAASSGGDIVGYAIPVAKVVRIAGDLVSGVAKARYDYGSPAFMGVGLESGTTVAGVYDGTPAAEAGLAEGDTITSVGGVRVTTQEQLSAAVSGHSPGDRVGVTWTDASGTTHTATLTLTTGPVA